MKLEDVKAVWARELADFSKTEILCGLNACRSGRRFPPSLPEFLELCRPPMDPEVAFYQAVEQMKRRLYGYREKTHGADEWPVPALYWAARDLMPDLLLQPHAVLRARWKHALELRLAECPGPVPPYGVALPSPGLSLDEQRSRLAQLRRELNLPDAAHKIPAEPAAEDPEFESRRQQALAAIEEQINAGAR